LKIPESSREIIRFIILIFFLGLIFAIPIDVLTRQPFWIPTGRWFTFETWSYIIWWVNVFPEPAAGFLAIYAALELERRNERRQFLQRVREIVPYIYFELLENKSHIEDFRKNQSSFINDSQQFNDSSWEMFKDDIKKWQEQNVVPLTRIYFCLSYINRKIENNTLTPDDPIISKRIISAYKLINKQLQTYDLNYFNNEKNLEELRNVSEIYYEASLIDEDLQSQTIMKLDNETLRLVIQGRIQNIQIKQLGESSNYAASNRMIQKLKETDSFSENQINDLLFWYLDNDQISGSSAGRSFLHPLFERQNKDLHFDLRSMYDLYVETGFQPTHRPHLYDIIKRRIVTQKPDLTIESLNILIQKELDSEEYHIYDAIDRVIQDLEISLSCFEIWKEIIEVYL